MASTWTLNSIQIFTQSLSQEAKQIIARLQPLDSGTIHQFFGYESQTIKLSGIVVGESDRDAIEDLTETGLSYALVGPWGSVGNFYVSDFQSSPRMVIYQTIRPDLPCSSTVYNIELELYKA